MIPEKCIYCRHMDSEETPDWENMWATCGHETVEHARWLEDDGDCVPPSWCPLRSAVRSRGDRVTSLEYADRILGELLNGKIAESVSNCDSLECMIACTDGSVIRVTGYWVSEIAKRIESTDNATPYMSPSAIEDVT